MVSEEFYNELPMFIEPEILRIPLDKLILRINTLRVKSESSKLDENYKELLDYLFSDI